MISHPLQRGIVAIALVAGAVGCGIQQNSLAIRVVDGRTRGPVAGANVTVNYREQLTNAQGVTNFLLKPDAYDVTVAHAAYLPLTTMVVLYPGGPAARTVTVYPRPDTPVQPTPAPGASPGPVPSGAPTPKPSAVPAAAIFGRITDEQGTRLKTAMVMVETPEWGLVVGSANANVQGEYKLTNVPRGRSVKVTAVADGYDAVSRTITPTGDYRLDFAGAYGLRKHIDPAPAPERPSNVAISGTIEDTMGRRLDGVMINVESSNVRYPFSASAIGRDGRYRLVVPVDLPLKFTASKPDHRTVSFVESVPASTFGGAARVDFTGPRALDPTPILEGANRIHGSSF